MGRASDVSDALATLQARWGAAAPRRGGDLLLHPVEGALARAPMPLLDPAEDDAEPAAPGHGPRLAPALAPAVAPALAPALAPAVAPALAPAPLVPLPGRQPGTHAPVPD